MKLTKNQVERICSTLSVRRPCINCGYDGPVNGPMKAVNLESSVLTSNEYAFSDFRLSKMWIHDVF